jgi:hypothetical protein
MSSTRTHKTRHRLFALGAFLVFLKLVDGTIKACGSTARHEDAYCPAHGANDCPIIWDWDSRGLNGD